MRSLSVTFFFLLIFFYSTEGISQTKAQLASQISNELQKGDTIKAIQLFDQYSNHYPEDIEANIIALKLKVKIGKLSEAEGLEQFKKLNAIGRADQFELFDKLDKLPADKAIEQLDILIAKYPNYHYNYYLKGQKLMELKRYKEAIAVFDQTIKIDPSFRYAYAEKALARYLLGDKSGACNAWKTSQGGGLSYFEKYCK